MSPKETHSAALQGLCPLAIDLRLKLASARDVNEGTRIWNEYTEHIETCLMCEKQDTVA
jgi:hypothetical protein